MASTRQEIIEELKQLLLTQDVAEIKDQVDHLKTQFYSIESEEAEDEFKALLTEYKTRRAEVAAVQAKEQAENLEKKQAILAEMKALVEGATADGVMANLQRMRDLQAEWKKIGPVSAEKTQEIRKAFQQYQEQFYDLVKINIELRDLDFKKNLELKTLLCEAAEKLQNNENIVEASRMLQQLHDEWAEIGPVARELRESLWERFKAASTVINKKHQAYFDELHRKEQENLERKQAIIEQLKAINEPLVNGEPLNAKQWEELTAKVQELQAEWRKIGFAPKKYNQSIYEAYRAECDRFFATKKEFFVELRERRKIREQKHKEYLERQAAREQAREERRKQRMERLVNAGGSNLRKLRDKLQQEIKTAENNILFFTAKSKTANKIVDDMLRKIEDLKARLAEIQQQLDQEENG
ncbi:MAG: DUF349 domain-containing protein [Paludibacteraceae bacterium]|nr:DUF349 domain-containing protein [Paludibacteraceae bacterium]